MLDGGFWIGLHNVAQARYFPRAFVSANVLRGRTSGFAAGGGWIMDSGAFTEVTTHGRFRTSEEQYAREVRHWSLSKTLVAAVSQDFMCEEFVLEKTGMDVVAHQRLTVGRYDKIVAELARIGCRTPLLPVLQGYAPIEYVSHLCQYGDRLERGKWVGVGSVCKRNATPDSVLAVLRCIKRLRPDLRLHGFGLKTTALSDRRVLALLHSADSMAWSDSARKQALPLLLKLREETGRHVMPAEARATYRSRGVRMKHNNGLREAREFYAKVNAIVGGSDGVEVPPLSKTAPPSARGRTGVVLDVLPEPEGP